MKILFFVCVLLSGVIAVTAQSKVVTNTDLDKYRAEREKATADYIENYAKRGQPSPEELDRRNEQSRKELSEVSAKIWLERQERERREAEMRYVEYYSRPQRTEIVLVEGYQTYYYPNQYYYPNGRGQRQYQQPGYFAGGQFWPTGPRTQSQPLFIQSKK